MPCESDSLPFVVRRRCGVIRQSDSVKLCYLSNTGYGTLHHHTECPQLCFQLMELTSVNGISLEDTCGDEEDSCGDEEDSCGDVLSQVYKTVSVQVLKLNS